MFSSLSLAMMAMTSSLSAESGWWGGCYGELELPKDLWGHEIGEARERWWFE